MYLIPGSQFNEKREETVKIWLKSWFQSMVKKGNKLSGSDIKLSRHHGQHTQFKFKCCQLPREDCSNFFSWISFNIYMSRAKSLNRIWTFFHTKKCNFTNLVEWTWYDSQNIRVMSCVVWNHVLCWISEKWKTSMPICKTLN